MSLKKILNNHIIFLNILSNLETKDKKSMSLVNREINKLMNVKNTNLIYVKERNGKDLRYTLNSNKINDYYSWIETTSLEEGIIKTIKWVKNNLNYFKKVSLKYHHKK